MPMVTGICSVPVHRLRNMSKKTYPFWKVRPHVFIIGAGASRAAFPNGDKNGFKLPLMSDFVDILNLEPILSKYNVLTSTSNIETIFYNAYLDDPNSNLLNELEDKIHMYFSILEIPDQ